MDTLLSCLIQVVSSVVLQQKLITQIRWSLINQTWCIIKWKETIRQMVRRVPPDYTHSLQQSKQTSFTFLRILMHTIFLNIRMGMDWSLSLIYWPIWKTIFWDTFAYSLWNKSISVEISEIYQDLIPDCTRSDISHKYVGDFLLFLCHPIVECYMDELITLILHISWYHGAMIQIYFLSRIMGSIFICVLYK